jgi:DNA invertase Pin-like site-specific DNA recombinase
MKSTFETPLTHTIGVTLAIPYVRFSTAKQEAGSSRDRQHELIRAMADQNGWTLGAPVEDLGRSAWKGDHIRRGALGKWTEAVKRGDVEPGTILVVEKIDRLSRQGFDVLNDWMREVIGHGIRIATVEDGKVYDAETRRDLGGYINRLLKAEGAFEYVDNMRGRVTCP